MTTDRAALAALVLSDLEDDIRERLKSRRWYRASSIGSNWRDLARDNDRELRKLLARHRKARRTVVAASRELAAGDFYAGVGR